MSFHVLRGSATRPAGGAGDSCASLVGSAAHAQPAAPPAAKTVQVNRAARDAWSPIMDVLKPSRSAVTVTEAQLQRLRELPLEAVWGALQNRKHVRSFEGGFQLTVPNPKLVGRAVTMRYLPVRPDLDGSGADAREGGRLGLPVQRPGGRGPQAGGRGRRGARRDGRPRDIPRRRHRTRHEGRRRARRHRRRRHPRSE